MTAPPDAFVFPPDSQIWRLSREHVLLAGGPAAAILQVAHPEIAAGVAAHSNFRADAYRRLRRTLDAVYAITFGTHAEADAVAARVRAVHAPVRGQTPVSYDAFSPEAQLWVLATLIMVGREMFERFVTPLTPAEREAHYRDMRVFGGYFGLDPAYGPRTDEEFHAYYQSMLAGPLLGSHPLCREVAWAVARPERPRWMNLLARPLVPWVAETLPTPVRERLGFRSTALGRALVGATTTAGRSLLPVLPPALRHVGPSRRAA